MTRPISILCLADIHYNPNGDMTALNKLGEELRTFINKGNTHKNNKRWEPDYIVIAGDLAEQGEGLEDAVYFIDSLCNKFNLSTDKVILVPGNHDVKTSTSITDMKNLQDCFKNFCENSKKNKKTFSRLFKNKFNEFIKIDNKYYNSSFNPDIIDKSLSCLSGVKVFEEDKLCFVQINTEWLYELGKDKSKITSSVDGNVEDISPYMRLDENCKLCPPLIKESYKYIKKNHPTHTVVTVMHRWTDHLSWEEKNISDSSQIDAIRYIKNGSDIIISGHDHIIHPMPPTLLDNRVQHFQLGSVGRPESFSNELSRFAEIIRLDSNNGIIEQLFIHCINNTPANIYWDFEEEANHKYYPLYNKFPRNETRESNSYDAITILQAKSSTKKDIKEAIECYFINEEEDVEEKKENEKKTRKKRKKEKILCLQTCDDLKNQLNKINIQINKKQKHIHIVVYYLYPEYINKRQKIKNILDKYRDKNIENILLNNLIISEVVVEYPDLEWINKLKKK